MVGFDRRQSKNTTTRLRKAIHTIAVLCSSSRAKAQVHHGGEVAAKRSTNGDDSSKPARIISWAVTGCENVHAYFELSCVAPA